MKKRPLRRKRKSFLSWLWQKLFWNFWSSNKKKKKVRVRQKKTIFTKLSKNILKRQWIIVWISVFATIIVLWLVILKNSFFAAKNTINSVLFDPLTVQTWNNEELFESLNEQLVDKNYYKLKRWWKENILSEISKEYPIVKDIWLRLEWEGLLTVSIEYNDPTLTFLLPENRRYTAFDNNLYAIWTGENLGNNAPVIELPRYTETLENIDWIFYQITEKRLFEVYSIITNTLWIETIWEFIYLPWGQKIFISYKWKRLYIHANKDVNAQLAKLVDLENFYEWFNAISVLDLWSVDDVIVK